MSQTEGIAKEKVMRNKIGIQENIAKDLGLSMGGVHLGSKDFAHKNYKPKSLNDFKFKENKMNKSPLSTAIKLKKGK